MNIEGSSIARFELVLARSHRSGVRLSGGRVHVTGAIESRLSTTARAANDRLGCSFRKIGRVDSRLRRTTPKPGNRTAEGFSENLPRDDVGTSRHNLATLNARGPVADLECIAGLMSCYLYMCTAKRSVKLKDFRSSLGSSRLTSVDTKIWTPLVFAPRLIGTTRFQCHIYTNDCFALQPLAAIFSHRTSDWS